MIYLSANMSDVRLHHYQQHLQPPPPLFHSYSKIPWNCRGHPISFLFVIGPGKVSLDSYACAHHECGNWNVHLLSTCIIQYFPLYCRAVIRIAAYKTVYHHRFVDVYKRQEKRRRRRKREKQRQVFIQ